MKSINCRQEHTVTHNGLINKNDNGLEVSCDIKDFDYAKYLQCTSIIVGNSFPANPFYYPHYSRDAMHPLHGAHFMSNHVVHSALKVKPLHALGLPMPFLNSDTRDLINNTDVRNRPQLSWFVPMLDEARALLSW